MSRTPTLACFSGLICDLEDVAKSRYAMQTPSTMYRGRHTCLYHEVESSHHLITTTPSQPNFWDQNASPQPPKADAHSHISYLMQYMTRPYQCTKDGDPSSQLSSRTKASALSRINIKNHHSETVPASTIRSPKIANSTTQ